MCGRWRGWRVTVARRSCSRLVMRSRWPRCWWGCCGIRGGGGGLRGWVLRGGGGGGGWAEWARLGASWVRAERTWAANAATYLTIYEALGAVESESVEDQARRLLE